MKKRILSWVLAFVMLVSLVPNLGIEVAAADPITEIHTAADLRAFANSVNSGKSYSGVTVTLKEDIDLSGVAFTPIGNSRAPFQGTFDGAGHSITNLCLDVPNGNYLALFGQLSDGGVVKNLTVGGKVNAGTSDAEYAAGIVAYNYNGVVKNCTSNVDVTGDRVVGGIVGNNYDGKIINCLSDGKVTGSNQIGGIAGFKTRNATIDNCVNYSSIYSENTTAEYVGAIAGFSLGAISNSYYLDSSCSGAGGGICKTASELPTADFINTLNATVTTQNESNAELMPWVLEKGKPSLQYLVKVEYQSPVFNAENQLTGFETKTAEAIKLTNSEEKTTINAGWYVVYGKVSHPAGLVVKGDVHLILADGCELTAVGSEARAGISVIETTDALTIYGQTIGTGKLTARGDNFAAGIGGDKYCSGRNITINGGIITAQGRGELLTNTGSGIGAGSQGTSCDNITINGGIVYATGGNGIGGAKDGDPELDPTTDITVNPDYTIKVNGQVLSNNGGDLGIIGSPVTISKTITPDTSWAGAEPYLISDAADLMGLANLVNGGRNFAGQTITLTNDIDLKNILFTSIGYCSESPYRIVGFSGTFDGAGYSIDGLYSNGNSYLGLFGYINSDGVVKNLTVSGSATAPTTGNGNSYVGGIAGLNKGTIENCISNVSVIGRRYVGGIAGSNSNGGLIINCINNGSVYSSVTMVGGITGTNSTNNSSTSRVVNCINRGTVRSDLYQVGGIVGSDNPNGSVEYCVNIGAVSIGKYDRDQIGAAKGSYSGAVSNSYYLDTSCVRPGGATAKTVNELNSADFVAIMNTGVATYNEQPTNTVKARQWKLDAANQLALENHLHKWSYTAENGILSARCVGEDCPLTAALILALTAEDATYTGESVAATFDATQSATWKAESLTLPTIQYVGRDGTSYESSTTAPTNAGKYTASITVGDKTASVDYSIAKRTWETDPTVSMDSYDYGSTPSTPTNSAGVTGGVTYYYNTTETNEDGTAWDATATLASGTYYLYAVFTASENMESYITEPVEFKVNHVHTYGYIASGSNDSVIASCTSTDECEGEVRTITLKTADAEYTGKTYEPSGVALFEKEAKTDVTVTYYEKGTENTIAAPIEVGEYTAKLSVGDVTVQADFKITPKLVEMPTEGTDTYTYTGNSQTYAFATAGNSDFYTVVGNTQTNAGDHEVTVSLKSTANTAWVGGSTEPLSFTFTIGKMPVDKPTAGTKTYTYSGKEQTYVFGTFDSKFHEVKDNTNKRTNAGTQNVVVGLKDTSNTMWADLSTGNVTLTDAFTIAPMKIPTPLADPRTFVADGTQKNYMALYLIGNYYYNFDGEFYKTTNNTRTEVGTQTVFVTPTDNYAWEDGTKTAKQYTFTVKPQQMNARIYYLQNQSGSLVTGYDYGSYLYDDTNGANTKVKTHFTPYIYNYPANATYTFYVCSNPANKSNSIKWDDLTYKSLYPGVYYVYAKVSAPGYSDYETPACWFRVQDARIQVTSCKIFSYKGTITCTGKWGRTTTTSCDRSEQRDFKSRIFSNLEEAKAAMLNDLNTGCSSVLYEVIGYSNRPVVFNQSNKAALAPAVRSSSTHNDLEPKQDNVPVLELTADSIINMGIDTSKYQSADKELYGGEETLLPEAFDFAIAAGLSDDGASAGQKTVNFLLGYSDDAEEPTEADLLKNSIQQKVSIGDKLTAPETPNRSGYVFKGWYDFPATTNTKEVMSSEADAVAWDFENDVVTDDIRLFAQWEKKSSSKAKTTEPTETTTEVTNPFVDVLEGTYYKDAVLWAVAQGITTGTSETTFSPDAVTTRGQMVTFLWRAAGSPVVNYAMNFADVDSDAYYAEAVRWAVAQGITNGTAEDTFSPDATVTRGQVATFLYRYEGNKSVASANTFSDVQTNDYYYDAVLWALSKNITNGTSATTFSPDGACTRGQVVTFLYRDLVK